MESIFGFLPDIGSFTLNIFRTGYAVCLLATLASICLLSPRAFLSQRWCGVADDSLLVRLVHNPIVFPFVAICWLYSLFGLIFGLAPVLAALVNYLCCRYFFHSVKFNSLTRGFGAVGFFCSWGALAQLLLIIALETNPLTLSLVVLVLQLDLAFILINAGLAKLRKRFWRNSGIELTLTNPMYCYWSDYYLKLKPGSLLYTTLNHLSWSLEIVAGLLMIVPATRIWGGILLALIFGFVLLNFRFLLLAPMMILNSLLFLPAGGWRGDISFSASISSPVQINASSLFVLALVIYAAMLPVAHLFIFQTKRAARLLPAPIYRLLQIYCDLFGIGVWNVFTNAEFEPVVEVNCEDKLTGRKTAISQYPLADAIVLAEVFKPLATGEPGSFNRYLRQYIASVPASLDYKMELKVSRIKKISERFESTPVCTVQIHSGRHELNLSR